MSPSTEEAKRYTLAEAQLELLRRECGPEHKPSMEIPRLGGFSHWYCRCGEVVYEPQRAKKS